MSEYGTAAAAAAAAEPYRVVSAVHRLTDDQVGAGAPHHWILVEHDEEPLAFLSAQAASEARGRTPLEYLRRVGAGFTGQTFTADLSESRQLFRDRRGFGDPQWPAVIFDSARFESLKIEAPPNAAPVAKYCPKGPDPRAKHCHGCYCGRERD